MSRIQITPATPTQNVLPAAPSAPKSRNVYEPAICDRLAITSTSATIRPQPPSQPVIGPNARAHHVNVVPQSGSAWFRYLNPSATKSIGTNASTITTGAWKPTPAMAVTPPSVAARL